ncbi:glycoside hydrolase family 26 protein [Flavobacterium taihuense]|uniref:Glycoside hydrolase family 26 protein n=1 Tax=Flavobacterium taihuense TaxID=2857508 RepID=A0ABS6XX80_9FLAO|nr:glycosyl hydrolase [Flavobacterium taihuense]MBW4360871.1 glycoside hydrolase family 26 protein [Flavobacterium taihuense]
MKNLLKSIVFSSIIALNSCSKDDPAPDPVVVIPPVVVTDVLTTQNVKTYMVDKNATAETVALFFNLKKLAKTKFAIGQQDAFNGFYNNGSSAQSDIKKTTGYEPALLGSDFMFITDKNNNGQSNNWFYQQEIIITDDAKEAYAKGMINTFSWHIREPNKEDSFYAADMTTEQKTTAFKSILPGGVNNAWYKTKLDKIASVISNLKGSKGELIPIIFRPFHEFDGSWFWWGADFCSPEEYIAAYQFTVEYLRDTKGVHNILYAFSPDNSYATSTNYLSRYPGDAYVDVLGMDNYGDLNNLGQTGADKANAKLKMLSGLAISKVKIAAMTETGYRVTATVAPVANWFSTYLYSALTANSIQISYVMFWNNSQDGYYVPTPTASNAGDFKTFSTKSKSALVNTLPSMYVLPN